MTRIAFNNDLNNMIELIAFNHSINYDTHMNVGFISLAAGETTTEYLQTLEDTPITQINLFKEEKAIYTLNTNARISSIDEYLQNDQVIININLIFNSSTKSNE